jgi:predicted phosphodiesterase
MSVINTAMKRKIVNMRNSGMQFKDIGKELGLAVGTVKTHYYLATGQPSARRYIPESRFVRYDEPPVIEGDALVLPDVEIPFQDSEFVNRVIDLANAWGIKQVIAAGDLMHFDSLSGWEPNWHNGHEKSTLTEKDESALMDLAKSLPKGKQAALIEITGNTKPLDGKDFGDEMGEARKVLNALDACFESFTWVLGNHEGRLIRAINSPTDPAELLNIMRLEAGKWKIAPYYYCILNSGGKEFRITHPKTAADNAARMLAIQYHQNILMGHSHKLMYDWDPSGKYAAVQMGHCVDEMRLAYAAQRDARRNAHLLGAVIVRDGYIWLLHENCDWERLKRLA